MSLITEITKGLDALSRENNGVFINKIGKSRCMLPQFYRQIKLVKSSITTVERKNPETWERNHLIFLQPKGTVK